MLSVKHRTILTICYAAGLRISEAISLKSAMSIVNEWSFE
jgi:site-specific recombinase XerD